MLAFALDNASPCTVQRQYIGNEFFRASRAEISATAQMFNFLNLFIMNIYLVIDDTNHTQSITASEWLATKWAEYMKNQGHEMRIIEGDLKTQGKNFHTWAQMKNK